MLNSITMMGRLTRDPELRRTPNGKGVCSFTLAVDRDTKNDNGERCVDFIECVAWDGTAEFVAKHLTKGSLVCILGRLQISAWSDKEGNKHKSAEVIVRSVYFAGSKPQDGSYSTYASSVGKYAKPAELAEIAEEDGDFPF